MGKTAYKKAGWARGKVAFGAEVPTSVLDEMLQAEVAVTRPEISRNANVMLHGRYWTGTTRDSITVGKPHNYGKDAQREILLTFKGSRPNGRRKTKRNAEVAFLNEYGSANVRSGKKNPAREFIQEAVDATETQAVSAAETIFRKWQNENV